MKLSQRSLQVSLGLGLIVLALGLEFMAADPPGLYVYGAKGQRYQGLAMGMSRQACLEMVSRMAGLRKIKTCVPGGEVAPMGRKTLALVPVLAQSRTWICHFKRRPPLRLEFSGQDLAYILVFKPGKEGVPGALMDCSLTCEALIQRFVKI